MKQTILDRKSIKLLFYNNVQLSGEKYEFNLLKQAFSGQVQNKADAICGKPLL